MIKTETRNTNGELTVILEGRLDSTTAPEAEKAIFDAVNGEKPTSATVDAEKLEYISSAGLRVMLKLRKTVGEMKIVNVSNDIYEIFEMTGFTEMITVEKGFRNMSVDGCPMIGRGAKGTVYRLNSDTIIKVYKNPDSLPDIRREHELARKAFVLGIPTAISYDVVKVGDKYGSVFELIDSKSFSQLISENPDKIAELTAECIKLLKEVHSTDVKPTDMPDTTAVLERWVNYTKDRLEPDDAAKLTSAVSRIPHPYKMIHGDFHTNNVMMQGSETILIDMDTLSYGHPIIELANIYTAYVGFGEIEQSYVENFIGLPYATCCRVWEIMLEEYFGTADKDLLKGYEDKIRILAYCRILRHFATRDNAELAAKAVSYCREQIHGLLKNVDELYF